MFFLLMRLPFTFFSSVFFAITISSCSPDGLGASRLWKEDSASPREFRRTIKGKPVFSPSPSLGLTPVDIPPHIVNAKLSRGYLYWPPAAPSWKGLDPAKAYSFEIIRRDGRHYLSGTEFTDLEIAKVWDGEGVFFDGSICEVHHGPMYRRSEEETEAEGYPANLDKIVATRFPHDGMAYLRCGSTASLPTWVCPACEKASRKWREAHEAPWLRKLRKEAKE